MKILNIDAFCLTNKGDLGIANPRGTTASQAWNLGDEAFNSIGGRRFSWIAPNGEDYEEDSSIFSRPTVEQIEQKLTPALTLKALELGIIEV